jgi:putative iron-only hydrogenase system regulator
VRGGKTSKKENTMETRVAILGIIVENNAVICDIQNLLSEYSDFIIGRMGIPYKQKDIRIISVVLDAPVDTINALTGKIGKIEGVSAKTVYSKG